MHTLKFTNSSVIGTHQYLETPFGYRPLVYADYTASGRSIDFIESWIGENVLPFYANTHSETSFTGAQTNHYREQARDIIRSCVNGGPDDKVVFCGSGATAAVNKLIDILGLRNASKGGDKPVVFIGPYEHHSNELPWRESEAELVVVPADEDGQIDLQELNLLLDHYADRSLKVGSFSAASNVTGLLTDVLAISRTLREAGALSFFDFAAAAPYVPIDMSEIDGAFISPHKFPGGPGTPGILIAKSKVFRNATPVTVGGGTVEYVTPKFHVFLEDIEAREEGGTPAIVESIRAGLVFQLQQKVGVQHIMDTELEHARELVKRLRKVPEIELIGNLNLPRLPIVSFRVKHVDKYLHYGFVTALLNDLFGIQARGGCSCAGPYAHQLLDLAESESLELCELVRKGMTIYRPGWTRISVNYFNSAEEIDYLLSAIEIIARHGWKLLPTYQACEHSGVWRHNDYEPKLRDLDLDQSVVPSRIDECVDFRALLQQAEEVLAGDQSMNGFSEVKATSCRWFAIAEDLQMTNKVSTS